MAIPERVKNKMKEEGLRGVNEPKGHLITQLSHIA
jgi:hypothetical protein